MTDRDPHGCTIDGQPAMPILISEYNQLTTELAALHAVARGYCPHCGRGDAAPTITDWEQQKQRADDAEAELRLVDAMRQQNLDSAAAAIQRAERAEAALNHIRALRDDLYATTGARYIADAIDHILDGATPGRPTGSNAPRPPSSNSTNSPTQSAPPSIQRTR